MKYTWLETDFQMLEETDADRTEINILEERSEPQTSLSARFSALPKVSSR